MQSHKPYPTLLVEHILNNLATMMTVFAQNPIDNLVAEQFVALCNALYDGNPAGFVPIITRAVQGMFTYRKLIKLLRSWSDSFLW